VRRQRRGADVLPELLAVALRVLGAAAVGVAVLVLRVRLLRGGSRGGDDGPPRGVVHGRRATRRRGETPRSYAARTRRAAAARRA
jgi:hypothetical protein